MIASVHQGLAGVFAALLVGSTAWADDPVEYVITYDPSLLPDAGTEVATITEITGIGKIALELEDDCPRQSLYRHIALVFFRNDETTSVRTEENFAEWDASSDNHGGNTSIRIERPFGSLDRPDTLFDLFGAFGAIGSREDSRGFMRIELKSPAGEVNFPSGSFSIPAGSAWPMEAYWRIVEALRAGETAISFPLGPFGMPGILPPLEDNDGLVVARVIDWPEEPGSFPPPDDEIFSGRKWAVSIEVSQKLPTMHAPRHWVVELYESGAPGRWIYDFRYVQILMQPVSVTREPAQKC